VQSEPTLLFCVGATKAGTSWLYDQLAAHPECHLRTIKELRYFETVEHDRFKRRVRALSKTVESLRQRKVLGHRSNKMLARKLADVIEFRAALKQGMSGSDAYLSYLTKGRNDCKVAADITPSYALLPVERLRMMAEFSADTRVLYLMRDPVARLWSQIRMIGQRTAETADAVPEACFALMERVLAGEQNGMTERGDYAAALQRLWAAVDPSKLMVMFMEDMLSPAGLKRLCDFLGIDYHGATFDRPVHVGPALALSADQKTRARALLRPQYEFVARHFSDIPENWRKNMGEGL
jgi:hypothetical protein